MTIRHMEGRTFEGEVRGHRFPIDLPKEMRGKDTGPTPPELFVAGLAACIGMYVVFYCEKTRLSPAGLTVETSFEKAANPDRISKINISFSLPSLATEEHKAGALKEAEKCLVHNTLLQKPEINIGIHTGSGLAF